MPPLVNKSIRWLLTGVIVALLIVFARNVDWHTAWKVIKSASPGLVTAAVIVNILAMVLKGVRWWLFLKPAGTPSLWLAVRAMLAGTGLNNILVANGGDAARVVFVSRTTQTSSSTVLATLVLDRIFDPIGFMIITVYTFAAYQLPESLNQWRVAAQIVLGIIAVLLIWFLYNSRNVQPKDIHEQSDNLSGSGLWIRFKTYIAKFVLSARALSNGPRFTGAIVISLIAWIAQLYTFVWGSEAVGVYMTMAGYLTMLLAINLTFLVRATPGNVGIFQVAYVLTASQFGIPREQAIAVSLLIQTIQMVPITLLGVALAPEFIFRRALVSERR